jgi:PAS domain S-box-containing protein/putative nucleotidyltransferase with HDIG domain
METVRILMVEENRPNEILIREYLHGGNTYKYRVSQVDSLKDAKDRLPAVNPDTILLDLELPDSAGLRAVKELHKAVPFVPIIVFTTRSEQALAIKAVQQGAQDYLIKGNFTGEVLGRSIHYAIERKSKERELEECDRKYHSLFMNVPDGIFRSTLDGRILAVNPALVKMLGYDSEAELLKVNAQEIYLEDEDRENFIREITTRRTVRNYEIKLKRKDGEEITVIENTHLVPDESGQPRYLEGTMTDITPLKKAEGELRESNATLQSLFGAMNDVVIVYDRDGRILQIPSFNSDFLVLPVAKQLGKFVTDILPEEEAYKILDAIHTVLKDRKVTQLEYHFEVQGKTKWCSASVSPLTEDTVLVVSREITELIHTREILRRSEENFRTLFENSPVALMEFDFSPGRQMLLKLREKKVKNLGVYLKTHPSLAHELIDMVKIADANQAAIRLTHAKSKEEFLGTFKEVFLADSRYFFESLNALFSRSDDLETEITIKAIGGTCRHLIARYSSAPGFEKTWARAIVSLTDITERKVVEEALRDSETRFHELFSSMKSGVAVYQAINDGEDFAFVDFNRAAEQIDGISRASILGKKVTDVFPGIRKMELLDVFQRVLRTGIAEHLPAVMYEDERLMGWRENFVYRLPSREIVTIYDDVTEQKKTEERFRSTLDNMLEGCQIISPDWRYVYINDAAARQGRNEKSEMIGHTMMELYPGIEHTEMFSHLKRCMHKRLPYNMENLFQYPGGSTAWFELRMQPAPEGVFILSEEITDRKQVEKEVRSLSRFPGENPNPVLRVSPEGVILYANEASKKCLKLFHTQVGGQIPEEIREEIRQAFKEGSTREIMQECASAAYSLAIAPIVEEGYINIYGKDITQTIAATRTLRQSEQNFRSLFEDSPISLWEADYSGLKKILEDLHAQGIKDIKKYLVENPDLLEKCLQGARILNVNKQTLRMYHATNRKSLLGNIRKLLGKDLKRFLDALAFIYAGRNNFELETILNLQGMETRIVIHHFSALPGSEASLEKVLISEVDITDRVKAEKELERRNIDMSRLYENAEFRLSLLNSLRAIDISISSSFDLKNTLAVLCQTAIEQLNVSAADILDFDPILQRLVFTVGRGFRTQALRHTQLRIGEGYAGKVALERSRLIVENLLEHPNGFSRSPEIGVEGFLTYIGIPLIAKGQLKGVLETFSREKQELTEEWLGFLETLAGQAAIAIDNAELFHNLQNANIDLVSAYDSTLEGWSHALDIRDKETEGHTQRVTELAVRFARRMGLNEKELVNVRRGALLHDIGKIGVPDFVLQKPGPLSDTEWVIMRKHPQLAYDIMQPIRYLHEAIDIPYCHHEKWDGSGYPRGLKGEQIPLVARVFAVVDVYDALTSDRPYRPAWSKSKTLQYIRDQSGKHFDPSVVEIFLKDVNGRGTI